MLTKDTLGNGEATRTNAMPAAAISPCAFRFWAKWVLFSYS